MSNAMRWLGVGLLAVWACGIVVGAEPAGAPTPPPAPAAVQAPAPAAVPAPDTEQQVKALKEQLQALRVKLQDLQAKAGQDPAVAEAIKTAKAARETFDKAFAERLNADAAGAALVNERGTLNQHMRELRKAGGDAAKADLEATEKQLAELNKKMEAKRKELLADQGLASLLKSSDAAGKAQREAIEKKLAETPDYEPLKKEMRDLDAKLRELTPQTLREAKERGRGP